MSLLTKGNDDVKGMAVSGVRLNLANAGAKLAGFFSYCAAGMKPIASLILCLNTPAHGDPAHPPALFLSDSASGDPGIVAVSSSVSAPHNQPLAAANGEQTRSLETTSTHMPAGNDPHEKPAVKVTSKWTTGFNQGFQLTLGGIFSDGINFQNSGAVDVNNLVSEGDVLQFSAVNHSDTGSSRQDRVVNFNYFKPIAEWANSKLVGTVGYHIWQFPSVILDDRLMTALDTGLVWTRSGSIGLMLDANVKTLLTAPGDLDTGGQVLFFRGIATHTILQQPSMTLTFSHGPSYAYANHILGIKGHRVARYELGVQMQRGAWGIDIIYRPQLALQQGIPENHFWGIDVFYLLD